jgi:cytochrome oxidase Cu insertion factor (SCO1/SenC/PrrC family)
MNQQARRFEWVLWGGVVLTLLVLLLAFLLAQLKLRAALGNPLPVYGTVAPFTLTNQMGQAVSLDDVRGRVWVADVIFTRCAGPCLKMSRQMRDLQNALPGSSEAKLVSLTTDTSYDTPPILKAYGERFGADFNRWMFLTGDKKEVTKLLSESLKLTALEKNPAERETPVDLFIHSTIFVIVDKHAQMRGVFETSGETTDPQKVRTQMLAAIRRLERER